MNCLVVGSNASIGDSIVKHFYNESYNVFKLNRTNHEKNKILSNYQLELHGPESELLDCFPQHLNVIIYCFGKIWGKSALEYSAEEVDQCFYSKIISIIKLLKFLQP